MFSYETGEKVKENDIIHWAGKRGIVENILLSGTQDAKDYGAVGGGILLKVDWEGGQTNSVLERPVDGVFDEDLEFVRRQ